MTVRSAFVLLPLASVTSGCGCDLDATARELAGTDATDCGAADGDDVVKAWTCAVRAFRDGNAFRISTQRTGIDSTITSALVSDGGGLWKLSQDDYGGSGGIDGWDCVGPFVDVMPPDPKNADTPSDYEYVACHQLEPDGNHYQVCGGSRGENPKPLAFNP